jgi:hypothetical protein
MGLINAEWVTADSQGIDAKLLNEITCRSLSESHMFINNASALAKVANFVSNLAYFQDHPAFANKSFLS